MPTITLTITLTVPEGTTVQVKTDEPTVEPTVLVEVPAIEEPESIPVFHGEYGEAPSVERTWVGWWSEVEDELAQDLEISDEELASAIDRTVAAVHTYRAKQGYYTPKYQRVLQPTRRSMARWTDVEDAELLRLAASHSNDWDRIGMELGRSSAAVQRRFVRMVEVGV